MISLFAWVIFPLSLKCHEKPPFVAAIPAVYAFLGEHIQADPEILVSRYGEQVNIHGSIDIWKQWCKKSPI